MLNFTVKTFIQNIELRLSLLVYGSIPQNSFHHCKNQNYEKNENSRTVEEN